MIRLMFVKNKEVFLSEATKVLEKALLKKGIILSSYEGFDKALLEIGNAYYKIKKKEEL